MGRRLAGGLLGQPPIVAGRVLATGVEAIGPDTVLNALALLVDQKDPDTDIARFLASGVAKWRMLYGGDFVGAGNVGQLASRIATLFGTALDLSGNGVVAGNLTVNGSLDVAGGVTADALAEDVTNAEADALVVGEVVQLDPVGPLTVRRANASAMATSDVFGVTAAAIAAGAVGKVNFAGLVSVLLVAGLAGADTPDEGMFVYLSKTAGRGTTTVAGFVAGDVSLLLGKIVNATGYVVDSRVRVKLLEDAPTQL